MTPRPEFQQQKLTEEFKAKQSNILWPDAMKNSRGVDEFLWKGAPNAPLVQRIGAWIFGIVFLLFGIAFLDIAHRLHSPSDLVIALAFFGLGTRVCLNGFRRSNGEAPVESSEASETELSDKSQPDDCNSESEGKPVNKTLDLNARPLSSPKKGSNLRHD